MYFLVSLKVSLRLFYQIFFSDFELKDYRISEIVIRDMLGSSIIVKIFGGRI